MSKLQALSKLQTTAAQPGTVYLVGAGPGDPELLTMRALRLLESADIILPDDLVSDEILALASGRAQIIPVGKRCGEPRIAQAGIHILMLEHARAGRSVVRLKSGDPLVFGRINEELEALRDASITVEIVPGISTVFAVAAALQTPLTDRASASRLVLATAHHAQGKAPELLFPAGSLEGATVALYMPGRDFAALAQTLAETGLPPETPVTAISNASTPRQQVTQTTLEQMPGLDPGPAPVLLLIGTAIKLP